MAKSAEAFRTISEASSELGVPQHVLRHWEDVFGQIRPMRRAGGRRYYRPVDIDLLRGVRILLYDERYTTKGVQKIFKENGAKYISNIGHQSMNGETVEIRRDLDALRKSEGDHDSAKKAPSNGVKDTSSGDQRPLSKSIDKTGQSASAKGTGKTDEGLSGEAAKTLKRLIGRLEQVQESLDRNLETVEDILSKKS